MYRTDYSSHILIKFEFLYRFSKNPQYFKKMHPVGAELFHVDRRTDMTKLIVNFHNFLNAPKTSWHLCDHNILTLCALHIHSQILQIHSLCIKLGYMLDDLVFGSEDGQEIHLFSKTSRQVLGPTQPPIQ